MLEMTQLARLGLFDAQVPRYTSYPTAPHFSGGVDSRRFAEWIEAIPQGSEVSLYVHVPFCRRLCWFCACRTQGTATAGPVADYVALLQEELRLIAAVLPRGVTLSRLHFGGGTPTLMDADMIRRLTDAIFTVAPMAAGGEFSVEVDPNEIDASRIRALSETGMTRASIGVQDFNPEIQATIGREQSYDVTRASVDMLREAGIESLNADILYGLPDQTPARMTESVQKLLSLSPDRVALYGYAHVPWMAKRQQLIPSDRLPSAQDRLALFETARKLFVWDGYDELGIDHFALPSDGLARAAKAGKMRRNFQGYTDDQADVLIGVGASSISRFPQGYAQNAPATGAHIKAIRDGRFSVARGHIMSGDDTMRARMIEALMCDYAISSTEIARDFGVLPATLQREFHKINTDFEGVLRVTEDGLSIPPDARPLTRLIARALDAYDLSKAGHSSAI